MDRQNRNAFQSRIFFGVAGVKPVVVGARERAGPAGILHQADGQSGGRIEHGVIHAESFDELDHIFRFGLGNFIRAPSAKAARPAVEGWKERISPGTAHAAVFTFEIFFDLFVIFVNMAVGVDDFGDFGCDHKMSFSNAAGECLQSRRREDCCQAGWLFFIAYDATFALER